MSLFAAGLCLLLVRPVSAQVPLTLQDAVARARQEHPDVRQADARVVQADGRVRESRAGFLPRLEMAEGWQRSDMPVFAFSALLSQRRFSASDFDIDRLNRPDAVTNFRSAVMVEQSLFDATLRAASKTASLQRDMAGLGRDQVRQEIAVATAEAFGHVRLFDAMDAAARAAVEAATEDRRRAGDRRDAGLATDADVLVMTVHLSTMRERQVSAAAELGIARARLNQLMGAPLDAVFVLVGDQASAGRSRWWRGCRARRVCVGGSRGGSVDETAALAARPDVRLAAAGERLAEQEMRAVRTAFLPQVVARAAAEWNGATFTDRAAGWMAGVDVRLNLFRVFADRARLGQARAVVDERRIARAAVEDRARLDVRAASARLAAAEARVELRARPSRRRARVSASSAIATRTGWPMSLPCCARRSRRSTPTRRPFPPTVIAPPIARGSMPPWAGCRRLCSQKRTR